MRTMTAILLLFFLAIFTSPAHARGAAGAGGHTHASSDLGGEYEDEDEGSTDDLGAEDLDEGDTDPEDRELEGGEEE